MSKSLRALLIGLVAIALVLLVFISLAMVPVGKEYETAVSFRAGFQPDFYQECSIVQSDEVAFTHSSFHKEPTLNDHDVSFGLIEIYFGKDEKDVFNHEKFSLTFDELRAMKPDTNYRIRLFYRKNIFGSRAEMHTEVE